MAEGPYNWFDAGGAYGTTGYDGFWPWPLQEDSNGDRELDYHHAPLSVAYCPEDYPELREWPEQSQYRHQILENQEPIPYAVHGARPFTGDDWQCTNENTPRISQINGTYYMGDPPQTLIPYSNGVQEYKANPGPYAYPVPFPSDQRNFNLQPFQGITPHAPALLEASYPPHYRQFSALYHHHSQAQPTSTRMRTALKRHQPGFNATSMFQAKVMPARKQQKIVNHASMSRTMEGLPAQMLNPIPVNNEPTSTAHFNILMSRLRSFSTAANKEKNPQFSCPQTAQGRNQKGYHITKTHIIPSGRELFEKAKKVDKSGKYDNCYWDDRMDCFVNRAAGNIGPFWKG